MKKYEMYKGIIEGTYRRVDDQSKSDDQKLRDTVARRLGFRHSCEMDMYVTSEYV